MEGDGRMSEWGGGEGERMGEWRGMGGWVNGGR